jgi:hypothetical protein
VARRRSVGLRGNRNLSRAWASAGPA